MPRDAGDIWDGMGGPIIITAAGTERMGAFGIESATPTNLSDIVIQDNALNRNGTRVSWQAGNGETIAVRVQVSNRFFVCESADDGDITLPAAAFNWLPNDARSAGVRVSRIMKSTIASMPPEGAIDIVLERRWIPDADRGVIDFAR